MSDHPAYMDYPFLCDEKTGDRCKAQCETCRRADSNRQEQWKREREERAALDGAAKREGQ